MSKTLWNEGRVVGYSAYELYVRHAIATDPDHNPVTEVEWLASMLGSGSSMLLHIGTDTTNGLHYRDFTLPENSRLCASSTILASMFIGIGSTDSGEFTDNDSGWATKVTSYGPLINNNVNSSPLPGMSSKSSSIPPSDIKSLDLSEISDDIRSYANIIDGIVIQPGTWTTNPSAPPQKSLTPDLSKAPSIRIAFADKVTKPIFVLFTGFLNRSVVPNSKSISPNDGDFLGPSVFPWSNKIIFHVPAAYMSIYASGSSYARKFPANQTNSTVKSEPIIDMTTSKPGSYYKSHDADAAIDIDVTNMRTLKQDLAVLATYHKSDNLPPALYGTVVSQTGSSAMYPIDTVAPGTVKLLETTDLPYNTTSDAVKNAKLIDTQFVKNTALLRDTNDYTIHERNQVDDIVPVAKISNASLIGVLTISDACDSPYLTVEGTNCRSGVTIDKLSGYDESKKLWENDGSTFSITYEGETRTGTWLEANPEYKLRYNEPFITIRKRITGMLSEKIRNLCGYEYDPSTKKLISGGYWDNATIDFSNIPESERTNYYYIIPSVAYGGGRATNEIVWPVRKNDNYIDVVIPYQMYVYTTNKDSSFGKYLIPSFYNDADATRNSSYLGSWWSNGSSSDGTTYSNSWAYIHRNGVVHPILEDSIKNSLADHKFVYQGKSLLPVIGLYENFRAFAIFGEDSLNQANILEEYQQLTLKEFFETALTHDMSTGELLDVTNPLHGQYNIQQPLVLYTNGKSGNTFVNAGSPLLTLTLNNTPDNVGKAQLLRIPNEYKDPANDDPQGVIIQTGNQSAIALSMSDADNIPYSIYGTDGDLVVSSYGKLTWQEILIALSKNKTLNIFGNKLLQLVEALNSSGNGNYLIKIDNGRVTLTSQ